MSRIIGVTAARLNCSCKPAESATAKRKRPACRSSGYLRGTPCWSALLRHPAPDLQQTLQENLFSIYSVGLVYLLLICQIIAHDWRLKISTRIRPVYRSLWHDFGTHTAHAGFALALVVVNCGVLRVFSSGCCETAGSCGNSIC